VEGEKQEAGEMQSAQVNVKEYSYFAGNEWRTAADNQVFEVHEPYTGKLFARVAAGTRADGRAAVDAAAKAYPAWLQRQLLRKPACS
jgi:acyl-CoA reductase-like NAD-dependent aldehyde dehydrogenase